jgi:hypothetical protein
VSRGFHFTRQGLLRKTGLSLANSNHSHGDRNGSGRTRNSASARTDSHLMSYQCSLKRHKECPKKYHLTCICGCHQKGAL